MKLDEYNQFSYLPDVKMQTRVMVGLFLSGFYDKNRNNDDDDDDEMLSKEQELAFLKVCMALKYEIEQDDQSHLDKHVDRLMEVVKHRESQVTVPNEEKSLYPQYEKASVEELVKAANAWLVIIIFLSDEGVEPSDYTYAPHARLQCIAEVLMKFEEHDVAKSIAMKIIDILQA